MSDDTPKIWLRLEDETAKAYTAFQYYLSLAPHVRTYENVQEHFGYKSRTSIDRWGHLYNWVERALAYDDYMAEKSLVLREVQLEQYKENIVEKETSTTTLGIDIVANRLAEIRKEQVNGGDVKVLELHRLVQTLDKLTAIARRSAGMPTQFTSDAGEDTDQSKTTYIIGGD